MKTWKALTLKCVEFNVYKITNQEQKKYDTLLARVIYASALPLSMVKNLHWKNFFNAVRPAYIVPSKYKISELLFDSEYDKIKFETVVTIAASDSVGLMCDGWSNIRNEPIINFVVSQPRPIFWKSFHTDLQSHTGEYIATEILKVIEELESERGKMVFRVVTDNASNMKNAWRLIEEKYPTIICYGCAARDPNLIFCDMIKLETCKNIIKRAKGVIKEFRYQHMLVDMLKAMQKAENVIARLSCQ